MNKLKGKLRIGVRKYQGMKRPVAKIPLSKEVAEIFEKWRRENLILLTAGILSAV